MSFLGRLNYISQFIAQSTVVCESILKMLKKDALKKWTEECQTAFDSMKNLCLCHREKEAYCCYICPSQIIGCVHGKHDKMGKKEQANYYISKNFTQYESCYTLL